MSEENRIRFAGLMEAYLNIPSFVCELIEKQLQDNKYKEVIEYVVQRRNEIENKVSYLSEQEKINQYLDLQQKVEQLEKENKTLNSVLETLKETNSLLINQKYKLEYELDTLDNKYEQLENIRKEAIELIKKYQRKDEFLNLNEWQTRDLLNILNKGDNNGK
ncbi:MAG: hypothetical protein IIV48_03210 [Clostridium sp.]|nr:hypothetical protein [Clostridium sp.]